MSRSPALGSGISEVREIRWIHGRTEWERLLHPGWWHQTARDVAELGGRAASCLWAEQDSTRYSIAQRCRGSR